jgi:hypothetical protein
MRRFFIGLGICAAVTVVALIAFHALGVADNLPRYAAAFVGVGAFASYYVFPRRKS